MDYRTSIPHSSRALEWALTWESHVYPVHTHPRITTQLDSSLMYIRPSSPTSSQQADTSDLSRVHSWRPIWAHSKLPPCHWCQKPRNPENFVQYMTSHTPTTPCLQSHRSTPGSTATSSHAHGEPFPQCSCLWHASPRVLKRRYGMSQKRTGQSPQTPPNGPASSSAYKRMTSLQLTSATISGSLRPAASMAWSPMPVQTSFEAMASVPWRSGSTTTYFSESRGLTVPNTTSAGAHGSRKYSRAEGAGSAAVMAMLRKMSDFVYFLPFLFSLYYYSEPSGTFYDDPPTSALTHTLDYSSMT